MTKRGRMVTLLVALLFGAFLLWSTLASQHVECAVVVAFGKGQGAELHRRPPEKMPCARPKLRRAGRWRRV